MHLHHDRQGKPISAARYSRLLFDPSYKHVAKTVTQGFMISTVWLGADHAFGDGEPVLFETMIFRAKKDGDVDWASIYCRRHHTEHDAWLGHAEAILWLEESDERKLPPGKGGNENIPRAELE